MNWYHGELIFEDFESAYNQVIKIKENIDKYSKIEVERKLVEILSWCKYQEELNQNSKYKNDILNNLTIIRNEIENIRNNYNLKEYIEIYKIYRKDTKRINEKLRHLKYIKNEIVKNNDLNIYKNLESEYLKTFLELIEDDNQNWYKEMYEDFLRFNQIEFNDFETFYNRIVKSNKIHVEQVKAKYKKGAEIKEVFNSNKLKTKNEYLKEIKNKLQIFKEKYLELFDKVVSKTTFDIYPIYKRNSSYFYNITKNNYIISIYSPSYMQRIPVTLSHELGHALLSELILENKEFVSELKINRVINEANSILHELIFESNIEVLYTKNRHHFLNFLKIDLFNNLYEIFKNCSNVNNIKHEENNILKIYNNFINFNNEFDYEKKEANNIIDVIEEFIKFVTYFDSSLYFFSTLIAKEVYIKLIEDKDFDKLYLKTLKNSNCISPHEFCENLGIEFKKLINKK